jgi:hypothetical protein
MGKLYDSITGELSEWLGKQKMFFVATAPLSGDGHVNSSPKGGDTFRILGPNEVAYADLTGSGIETAAHLRENGRIVLLFCSFEGPPRIVRLHGRGTVCEPDDALFATLSANFPKSPGLRAVIRVNLERISDSCGFGVPLYQFIAPRDALEKYAETKGVDALRAYRAVKNKASIDGLPGLKTSPPN